MATPELREFYNKHVPRWFKVIRWRDAAKRTIKMQKMTLFLIYLPIGYYYFLSSNPYHYWLCIKRPQTDEERLALKRDIMAIPTQRDWQMGQYHLEVPPLIDVWKRRMAYPEHYGEKYNGFKRDDVTG